jgi:hypothetical protein
MIIVALCYFDDDGELKRVICFGEIRFLEQFLVVSLVSLFVGQCFKLWSL